MTAWPPVRPLDRVGGAGQSSAPRNWRLFTGQAATDPLDGLGAEGSVVLGLSWLLILALGAVPLLAHLEHLPHLAAAQGTLAFCIAVGSAALLRRHYSWFGAALHIAGQIMIWLSLFILSLAVVLF